MSWSRSGTGHGRHDPRRAFEEAARTDEAKLDRLIAGLGEGGTMVMPPDNYDFSLPLGWVSDRSRASSRLNHA
ncbi:MAG TPA: hypothetical protein VEA61_05995 [Allosphingosinicella sp.]|nr:hypothetical protein [Allosphingosinicella sp.]